MTGATLKIFLAMLADALAVFGGVALYFITGSLAFLIGGVMLSAPVALFVLLPALKELQAEKKGARDAG